MRETKTIRKKIKKFLKNQNFQIVLLVILVIIDTLMITNLLHPSRVKEYFCLDESSIFSQPEGGQTFARLQTRALDGVLVKEGQATSSRPLALVIENHFQSWPQTGLAEAELVYEFLTEGGITRFLAFYDPSSAVKKIGPVRSCRPYMPNVAEEYQALFAHIGGSPDCLALIKNRRFNIYDLDEYAKTNYFWRSDSRFAPHNVYTSTELLSQYLSEKQIESEHPFESWQFKDENKNSASTPTQITVDFSTYTYKVTWQYDEKNNVFSRYRLTEPHNDASGKPVKAKNIVIQYVKAHVLDSLGRLSIQMEGRGEALVFQDGQVITGFWKKPTRQSRTRFYSESGDEVQFNRGATWIEVVPTDREVSYE